MARIKCPMCKGINLLPGVKDGEMVKCSNCNTRFTVTKIRRLNIPLSDPGGTSETRIDAEKFEEFVTELDMERLILLVSAATSELVYRYKNKESMKEGLL